MNRIRVVVLTLAAAAALGVAFWTIREDAQAGANGTQQEKGLPPAEAIAKLPADGGPEFNRLIFDTSPYLLQHARNPVDWFPWGEEALQKARKDDKPIFLSVGYSTCHWCHVMERESFEDLEVARVLNEGFVAIKVDREQRPDIDSLYMTVTQAMTGRGGWPMTVIMTFDGKPFFAGTYFRKPDLLRILSEVRRLWKDDRQTLLRDAENAANVISSAIARSAKGKVGLAEVEKAANALLTAFDSKNGGFETAPKFPSPHNLLLLIRHSQRTGDAKYLNAAELTLKKMRLGGIYDQIGFGFHRYSTDAIWRVPHFEKMLYDQAMLVLAYTEAYAATNKAFYRDTADEVLEYVARDMADPAGGFHSAQDADSEGVEGKYYLWREDELDRLLSKREAKIARAVFRTTAEGNYHEEASGKRAGENVLEFVASLGAVANELGIPEEAVINQVDSIRLKLLSARRRRVPPLKDDKVLTDWNGLMIAACAKAGAAFGRPKWVERARKAGDFLLSRMRKGDGRLWHQYRRGKVQGDGFLEDYAFAVWGLIELYEASFEPKYLAAARELANVILTDFSDKERGGFFHTSHSAERLFARPKEGYDGAIPSGNSAAALGLLRLSRMLGAPDLEDAALETLNAFGADVGRSPRGFTAMLLAADYAQGPSSEVVVVGELGSKETNAMLRALRNVHAPRTVLLLKDPRRNGEQLAALSPYTKELTTKAGKATAYVCRNFTCDLPTNDPSEAAKLLRRSGRS